MWQLGAQISLQAAIYFTVHIEVYKFPMIHSNSLMFVEYIYLSIQNNKFSMGKHYKYLKLGNLEYLLSPLQSWNKRHLTYPKCLCLSSILIS